MPAVFFPRFSRQCGSAAKVLLVVLATVAAFVVAYLLSNRQPLTLESSAPPSAKAPATAATEPLSSPIPTPTPEMVPLPPVAAVSPTPMHEPPAPTPEIAPTIEAIQRTPTWWPKTVNLTRAVNIPVIINGQPAGKAQVPAGTSVKLVRVASTQVEIEYATQRVALPYAATDLLARAALLAKAPAAAHIPSLPVMAATPGSPLSASAATKPSPVKSANAKEPGYYHRAAAEVTDDIHERYWMRQAQRYASKPGGKNPDAVWGAGVMFSALTGAARHDRSRYEPLMRKFFDGLDGYWDTKAKIAAYEPTPTTGGHDKYYDDNAWMVITFFEAYELTGNPRYKHRAEETLEFVLSGWDDTTLGGGIWWHESREKKGAAKNTCANGPSAVACLLSAKYTTSTTAKQRLEMAEKITAWTTKHLQLDDGLFADSVGFDGKMNRDKLTYNSALMLRANLGLYRATKKPEYLAEAQRIGKAGDWFSSKETGAFRDAVKWSHLMVEADLELYRTTHEDYLLARATRNADYYYNLWKNKRPDDLIDVASIARILWLMADTESEVGRKFWQTSDEDKGR